MYKQKAHLNSGYWNLVIGTLSKLTLTQRLSQITLPKGLESTNVAVIFKNITILKAREVQIWTPVPVVHERDIYSYSLKRMECMR